MAKYFGVKKVIAIEPDEALYMYLCRNIELNGLKQIIIPFNIALWRKEGYIYLYKIGSYLSFQGEGPSREYLCTSLDKLVQDLGLQDISLIKIDTEGSELAIIDGAINTLRSFRPRLMIEVHSKSDRSKITKMLMNMGYKLIHEKINFPEGFMKYDYVSVLYFKFTIAI